VDGEGIQVDVATSTLLRSRSTRGLARPSAGRHPPRLSTNVYLASSAAMMRLDGVAARRSQTALRSPIE
jgi:hypothetical protein